MFQNRHEAGQRLAERLRQFRASSPLERPVVLAAPRGGVAVAVPVAEALDAELDVVLVRKLRHPQQPELAIGAVGEDGEPILSERSAGGLSEETIGREVESRVAELEERRSRYRAARSAVDVQGRDVIIVDDGVATGSTMEAAVHVVRRKRPRRVIIGLPVAPASSVERLSDIADDVVCVETPHMMFAVGQFYSDFGEITDDEVVATLKRAGAQGRSS